MSSINLDEKFNIIAEKVNESRNKFEDIVKTSVVKNVIISPSKYRECVDKEIKEISNDKTLSRKHLSLADFADLFKFYEDVPPCLQKFCKKSKESIRLSRASQHHSKDRDLTFNVTPVSKNPLVEIVEPIRRKSAKEIHLDFNKFNEKFALLRNALNNSEKQFAYYRSELNNLCKFGEDLDKATPSYDVGEDAFSDENKLQIKEILQKMEHFIYIQEQMDTYRDLQEDESCPSRLHHLMELISETLQEIKYVNQN